MKCNMEKASTDKRWRMRKGNLEEKEYGRRVKLLPEVEGTEEGRCTVGA